MSKTTSDKKKRKREAAEHRIIDPPLVTLDASLRATGDWVQETLLHIPRDVDGAFRAFVLAEEQWHKPSDRGDAIAFATAYSNSTTAHDTVANLAKRIIERGGKFSGRAEAAGRCVHASAFMVQCSVLTHLRAYGHFEYGTCVLLRTGVELAGRALFIALGTGDELTRFNTERFKASEYWPVASLVVSKREPRAWDPKEVYAWLCLFTHVDKAAMDKEPTREEAYAAIAYIAWFAAVAAEVVSGVPDLAVWPSVWPEKVPW